MTTTGHLHNDAFYHDLFEQADDGMLINDGAGRYTEANPKACTMLGYSREEILSFTVSDLWPEPSFTPDSLTPDLLPKNHNGKTNGNFRLKNGESKRFELTSRPISHGRQLVVFRVPSPGQTSENTPVPQEITSDLSESIHPGDDITFGEIFDLEKIQEIQDAFADAFGVASLITTPEGAPITRPSNFCELCKLIRSTEKGEEQCLRSDNALGRKSAVAVTTIQNCLSGGLVDAATRIFVGNRPIAFWLVGQVITPEDDEQKIIGEISKFGIGEATATRLLAGVTRMSAGTFQKITHALQLIANQLSESAYHNLQQSKYLQERRNTARKLATSIKKMRQQQKALSEILNYPGEQKFELAGFVRILTTNAARALNVEYVSVWLGNETEGQLLCIGRYQTSTDRHTRGELIFLKQFPVYFKTLSENRIIVSSDSANDPPVGEFVGSGYLGSLNICSMLDATVMVSGRLVGIVCFEQTGGVRHWTEEESKFAIEIADKMAIALLTSQQAQAEENLRESEMRFRQMFNNNNVVMMQLNPDTGNIQDVNPAALAFYGYSRSEMLNMNIGQINTMSSTEIYSAMQKTRHGRQNYFIFKHKLKSGNIRTVEVYGSAIPVHGRDIIFSIIHDITDRMTVEEENRKLSLAIEQSPISIVIANEQGNIEYVNQRFEDITGYKAAEVIGRNPSILKSGLTPDDIYQELWKTIHAGRTWRGELVNKRKDGSFFTESIILTPIESYDKKNHHFLALKEDITFKKQMETDLRAAKEKAEESDKLKTAFLNNMSHEIRTPLNAISGFADLLNDEDLTQDERIKYTSIINSNSDQLLGIVNDVLEISRLDSGRIPLHLSQFCLNELMNDIYLSFQPDIVRKKLDFNVSCPLPDEKVIIETDKEKLRQVLIGFIANALKFTDKGAITFGYTNNGDKFRCYVTDTGIGITEGDQRRIFERFYQASQPEGKTRGGTGLGLSIAEGIARLLNASLEVHSVPKQGSTFCITIETKPVNRKAETKKPGNLEELKSAVVLIAEDEFYNYEYLKALLSKHVAEIHHAPNGAKAVAMATTLKPHIILMDLKMPVMDGVEATRLIKAANHDQLIIAQTAYSQPEELNRLTEAGCAVCLTKPIRRDELLGAMIRYL